MSVIGVMKHLAEEAELEMKEHILPFWSKLQDVAHGGYYGVVNDELYVDKQADKGGIVTSRILWTFSAAYRVTGDVAYLRQAIHAYDFLTTHLLDDEQGGLYWLLDYKGGVKDDRKHVYAQSFGIYALSEYYRATGHEKALQQAKQLYELIETKGYNSQNEAYMEEFTRTWQEKTNDMLSGEEGHAPITTNTHLHVLEAYTNLYKVWPDNVLKEKLKRLVATFHSKIYDIKTGFLKVFFDEKWQSIIHYESYGHDIEASWLIDETLKVLDLKTPEYVEMVIVIAYKIADTAIAEEGAVINEKVNGQLDETRVWWVQAEAIVGFVNAYERTGDEKFITIARRIWDYTKEYIIDTRLNGEWFWSVEPNGKPSANRNIADPWKANYHNTRFCLELIERVNNVDESRIP